MKRKARGKAKSARKKSAHATNSVGAKSRVRAAAKAKRADALDALVTASAQALGLALDPAWHDSVAFNLRLILRHAALVDEFALPDDAEPAPVFHA
jgi:Protein of unknown function (DUF4089)